VYLSAGPWITIYFQESKLACIWRSIWRNEGVEGVTKGTSFALFVMTLAASSLGQGPARRLITVPIDEAKTVRLHGTVHPLANPVYDTGALADSVALERILLLLGRPPEREATLQQFLHDVQDRGSDKYHHWITPSEFGQRFGPADSDVQTVVGWLQEHGFNVIRVTEAKSLIEFSGNVGQLRSAFHTDIHQYAVNGELHFANRTESSIPAALAPLIRGTLPLNDFRTKPLARHLGAAIYSASTRQTQTKTQWTIPNPNGSGNFYALAPADFVTQYNVGPLYQAGIDGSGQTIGIINVSNVDVSLVNSYKQLFGLPPNSPQVVIDGSDPGSFFPATVEAYLDVEVSGAVAPGAGVNLYISDGGTLFDPLVFAALRAIEDNQVSVLSVSFGACEQSLGQGGNQLFSSLWQQAAAQGQTVLVSSGDSGSAGCDPAGFQNAFQGFGINGLASTPWNIAVGGTDFYYSDYASGAPSATALWNQSNSSNNGSLAAPLPEQVWNDASGLNVNSWGTATDIAAGGGASSCAVFNQNVCSGYPKPNWQTGIGVPSDGVRDVPDVSLFAADGLNLSAYPICVLPGDCIPNSGGQAPTFLVGGTSASSPAMAGIMALLNQKYGRQGQANVVLYPLAQQMPSAFHDITIGGNNVPVYPTTQAYMASTGYDLATGLGSIDASLLVNNWNSINFLPTTTSVSLSKTTITHGQPVFVSTRVTAALGSGSPTGSVAILTDSPLPANQGQLALTLGNGAASGNVNFFPGGSYHVFANYGGDEIFGESKSNSVVLNVKPENANLNFAALDLQRFSSPVPIPNGGTAQYGNLITVGIQPTGVSAAQGTTNGIATGGATFTLDSSTQTIALDSVGLATWALPTLALGAHTVTATYAGDSSFNASGAAPIKFTIIPGQPLVVLNGFLGPLGSPSLRSGDTLTANVEVRAPFPGIGSPPTGTVDMTLGNISQTVTLSAVNDYEAAAVVTFPNLGAGCYNFPMAHYNGDSNWLPATNGIDGAICVSPGINAPTTTTLSTTPSSISGSQAATFNVAVSVSNVGTGTRPTGYISFFDNGALLFNSMLPPSSSGSSTSITVKGIPANQFVTNGTNQITAVYSGDCCYSPSTSAPAVIAVANNFPDFTLAPQIPQVLVKAGSSGTVTLGLSSIAGFNGIVNLGCGASSSNLMCSINPQSVLVNGVSNTIMTINVLPGAAPHSTSPTHHLSRLLGTTNMLFIGSFLLCGCFRKTRVKGGVTLLAGLLLIASCGGGPQTNPPPPAPPPPPPTASNTAYYTVLVTGTANGVMHNSQIVVAVQ
jgi:Pro-kumamolisin, activation domain/Bacterial Ig-like domain (group 3)/Subtilase family